MTVFSIIMTIGIPGSGKTTWVENYKKEHPAAVIVSSDALRKELTGKEDCDPNQSNWIHDKVFKKVEEYMNSSEKIDVLVIDATNTDIEEWKRYRELHPLLLCAKVFPISVEEAFARQAHRERQVPRYAFDLKYEELQRNKKHLPYIFDLLL